MLKRMQTDFNNFIKICLKPRACFDAIQSIGCTPYRKVRIRLNCYLNLFQIMSPYSRRGCLQFMKTLFSSSISKKEWQDCGNGLDNVNSVLICIDFFVCWCRNQVLARKKTHYIFLFQNISQMKSNIELSVTFSISSHRFTAMLNNAIPAEEKPSVKSDLQYDELFSVRFIHYLFISPNRLSNNCMKSK